MMFVDISLACVVSQRPLCGSLARLPRPLSLMFPYSRRVMIVLKRPLYGVVSDGHVFGLFVPLPPAVFFLRFLFIYSTEIETASERGNTSRGSGRGRSRLIAEEPDVGLDPITLGSRPEPKADA